MKVAHLDPKRRFTSYYVWHDGWVWCMSCYEGHPDGPKAVKHADWCRRNWRL